MLFVMTSLQYVLLEFSCWQRDRAWSYLFPMW